MKFPAIFLSIFLIFQLQISAQPSIHIIDYETDGYPAVQSKYMAFDADSNYYSGLGAGDFSLSDNGTNIPVLGADCPEQNNIESISLCIAFDLAINSPRIGSSNFENARELARQIVINLDLALSECTLTSYDYTSYLNRDITQDRYALLESIDSLKPSRGSYFTEGLVSVPAGAVPIIKNGINDKAVILITDGTGDVATDSVVALANESNVRIYCITLEDRLPQGLKSICERTGGKWLEHPSENMSMPDLARIMLAFAHQYEPCSLSWQSLLNCDEEHVIEIEAASISANTSMTLTMPEKTKPHLTAEPPYLSFSSVLQPLEKDEDVTITAVNSDIHIDSMAVEDDVHFTILPATDLKDYTLRKGDSHKITIRFAPTDSAIVFSRLIIYSDACHGEEILMTGGFPNTPPNEWTIHMVYPNGGETLVIGDTAQIVWEGLLPRDVIQLEYTTNDGRSWDTLAKNVNGLSYDWPVPEEPSDSCRVRAIQLWPNNVGRTMDLRHPAGVNSALFNRDYNYVVTACKDGIARVWNANNGNLEMELKGHTQELTWACFSPDDKYIATSSQDSTAKIWARVSGELLFTLDGFERKVNSINFRNDSKKIITASHDGTIMIWDVATGRQDKIVEQSVTPMYFAEYSPFDDYIVTAGNQKDVNIWNTISWEKAGSFINKDINGFGYNIHAKFSQDGNKIVASSQLGGAMVWDFVNDQKICQVEHVDTSGNQKAIFHAVFDPTGDTLLTSGFDQKVIMWDANTGDSIVTFVEHLSSVKTAFFNFDGMRVLTSSWDSTAKIWNRERRELQMDMSDTLFSIAYADLIVKDINFGEVIYGEVVDTLVHLFLQNNVGFPFKIKDIRITGQSAQDYTNLTGFSPFVLDSGESRSIELRFKPSNLGIRPAQIEIDIPFKTITVELMGEGINPGLLPIADYIDFEQVELGDFKDSTISLIVRNRTVEPINITEISLIGPDIEHYDVIAGGDPVTINPEDGHEMTLRFTPEKLGRLNGRVQFEYDGKASPARVFLFGEGVPMIIDTATIALTPISGDPGDVVDMPVLIKDISSRGVPPNVTGYTATIRYNATLLEPIEPEISQEPDIIENNERIMNVLLPVDSDGDGVLTTMKFRVGLGNGTASPLLLENTAPVGTGKMIVYEESAEFTLTGVCNEGGERLFDSDGIIELMQNRPNPFTNSTELVFSIAEKGITKLYICDMLGNVVKTIISKSLAAGEYKVTVDASELPSGVYNYILQTPTQKLVRRMDLNR